MTRRYGAGIALALVLLIAAPTTGHEPSRPASIPDTAFQTIEWREPAPTPNLTPQREFPKPPVGIQTPPPVLQPTAATLPVGTPVPQGVGSSGKPGSLKGKASWYCNYDDPSFQRSVCMAKHPDGPGQDLYAAACGKLRRAMGGREADWRNHAVTVRGNGHTVRVILADWCGSEDKTIDLYRDAMDVLGGGGVVQVTVTWE